MLHSIASCAFIGITAGLLFILAWHWYDHAVVRPKQREEALRRLWRHNREGQS